MSDIKLDSKTPEGELAEKWTQYKSSMNLVAPNNKRRLDVIVVGTGLAGASAAATLGELGYNVKVFTFHDSPRRAHSIAAQGVACWPTDLLVEYRYQELFMREDRPDNNY